MSFNIKFEFTDTKNIGIDVNIIKIGPLLRKLWMKIPQFSILGQPAFKNEATTEPPVDPDQKIFHITCKTIFYEARMRSSTKKNINIMPDDFLRG